MKREGPGPDIQPGTDDSASGRDRARLVEGSVAGWLVRLSLPTTIGLFAVIAFNVVDTLYVGQLGPAPLAAMSFTFPVIFTIGAVAMGLGVGASALVSRAIGAGDTGRVKRLSSNALLLSVIVVGVLITIGLYTIDPLFTALGAAPELLPHIRAYMEIWYFGTLFLVVPMVGGALLRARGDSVTPSVIMVLAAILNAALSPLLVFGMFGFPRLEIAGAALATLITRSLTLVVTIALLHYREKLLDWSWGTLQRFFAHSRDILAFGAPASAAQMIQPMSTAVLTMLIAGFGTEAVAAFGVGARIEALFLIPFFALNAGVAPFVGQNFGANEHGRIRTAMNHSFSFSIIWGLISLAVLLAFGKTITGWFTPSEEIATLASRYLTLVSAGVAAAGMMFAATAAFPPLGRPLWSTGVTAVRFLGLYLPIGYVLSRFSGPEGVFTAALISYLVAGALSYLLTQRILNDSDAAAQSARPATGAA